MDLEDRNARLLTCVRNAGLLGCSLKLGGPLGPLKFVFYFSACGADAHTTKLPTTDEPNHPSDDTETPKR